MTAEKAGLALLKGPLYAKTFDDQVRELGNAMDRIARRVGRTSASDVGMVPIAPWCVRREVYPFAPSGAAFSASTITFQWGQEGSAAIWAWGNYTACAIANGPAVSGPDLFQMQMLV